MRLYMIRDSSSSTNKLGKLIKKALEGTNWHLMSEGITYRLGFLNGRLRGVEGQEELLELAKRNVAKIGEMKSKVRNTLLHTQNWKNTEKSAIIKT